MSVHGWTAEEFARCPALAKRLHSRILDLEDEVERLRERLGTMNECVRIYVNARDADDAIRPGWLEEELASTDELLNALQRLVVER